MAEESTVLAGALGALLGYLGGEVAEVSYFERLLWPQRFYNNWNLTIALKQCILFNMGGPVHSAALKTLDVFRKKRLYLGGKEGHMLGTAFYWDGKTKYAGLGDRGMSEARNGFWVEVSRHLQHRPKAQAVRDRAKESNIRAIHNVHYLDLRAADNRAAEERDTANDITISEDEITWKVVVGILCSETVSIIAAVVLATRSSWGMFAYMLLPLFLKYLAMFVSLDRATLEAEEKLLGGRPTLPEATKFEVDDGDQDYMIIEGSAPTVKQFFRHYGHPERGGRNAICQQLCIIIAYAFVLYFPTGLIVNVFLSSDIQYLWLAYQIYTVVTMHIIRLMGWQGCGRTEERVAEILGRTDSNANFNQLPATGATAVAKRLIPHIITLQTHCDGSVVAKTPQIIKLRVTEGSIVQGTNPHLIVLQASDDSSFEIFKLDVLDGATASTDGPHTIILQAAEDARLPPTERQTIQLQTDPSATVTINELGTIIHIQQASDAGKEGTWSIELQVLGSSRFTEYIPIIELHPNSVRLKTKTGVPVAARFLSVTTFSAAEGKAVTKALMTKDHRLFD